MKKIKFLFLTLTGFCLLLCACSQQEELGEKFQESTIVSLDLQINKADIVSNKAGELGASDYCADELPTSGTVTMNVSGSFNNSSSLVKGDFVIPTGSSLTVQNAGSPATGIVIEYDYDMNTNPEWAGRISDLIQIKFPATATSLNLRVKSFMVSVSVEDPDNPNQTQQLQFATPEAGSAYEDYVEAGVAKEFTIGLYEKEYIKMDVLCFQEQDIPLFGFSWFDFNVVSGEEICLFFNCMGNTASTYHQVFAGEFFAYNMVYDGSAKTWSDQPYWSSDNFTPGGGIDGLTDIRPFCVPCPGNWKSDGLKLVVYPAWDPNTAMEFVITQDMIREFIAETRVASELDWDPADYDWPTNPYTDLLTSLVLEEVNNIPFIHFTLKDCYKPDAFYSDYLPTEATTTSSTFYASGDSKIFAINYDIDGSKTMSDFSAVFAFEAPGLQHLAMTPDQSKLIMVETYADIRPGGSTLYTNYGGKGIVFRYFDIYTLEEHYLTYDSSNDASTAMSMYRYNELVYVDGELYGGCSGNNCLTHIKIDWSNETFSFGADYADGTNQVNFEGGDLVSAQSCLIGMTKIGSAATLVQFDIASSGTVTETRHDLGSTPGMIGITGSSMVVDQSNAFAGVLTATADEVGGNPNGGKFYYYNGNEVIITPTFSGNDQNVWLKESMTDAQFMVYGGDMASPWNTMSSDLSFITFRAFFPQPES